MIVLAVFILHDIWLNIFPLLASDANNATIFDFHQRFDNIPTLKANESDVGSIQETISRKYHASYSNIDTLLHPPPNYPVADTAPLFFLNRLLQLRLQLSLSLRLLTQQMQRNNHPRDRRL